MILLRLISWQYVRKHKFRWFLTIAGIVIGVAVLVGMHTANQSVLYAFQRTIDHIAGTTQLQVTAGDGGFPEEALEQVQAIPEIRAAAPVIEASVDSGFKGQGNILILGVDILKLIHDVNQQFGATVLMVTHDRGVAESCPRTISLRDGRIVSDERRAA